MSRLVLHRAIASPPSRACMMLANILDLKVELRDVNIIKLEHKTKEFKELNPMGTVPVLEDGDFILPESHAIMKYLLAKYGRDHQERLYPADLRSRARVDQCMFFSASVFFNALIAVAAETLMSNLEAPTAKHKANIENSYSVVEAFLKSRPYIATDRMSLADLSAGAIATAIQNMHKVDKDKFPRCTDWIARLEEETFFKTINKEGVVYFGKLLNASWEKNRQKNKQKS